MRPLLALFVPLLLVHCTNDESSATPVGPSGPTFDASAPGNGSSGPTTPGTPDAGDASSPDAGDASTGTPLKSCNDAPGVAFCVDFETSNTVGAGWNAVETNANGTLELVTEAVGSAKAARAKVTGTKGRAVFTQLVRASTPKSRVIVEFDARWSFPTWSSANTNLFFTLALERAGGTSGRYFIDIERDENWKLMATGTSGRTIGGPNDLWNHFVVSYDGSDASGVDADADITVSIGPSSAPLRRAKGPPPGGAPVLFKDVELTLGIEDNGAAASETSFFIDNVVVRFP